MQLEPPRIICIECEQQAAYIQCPDCVSGTKFKRKAIEMQPEKMTEEQIIQAWKDNKYMGFGGMPPECQKWARERKDEYIWGLEDQHRSYQADFEEKRVYSLKLDYQPPTPKPTDSDWVEFDIVRESYPRLFGGYYHWQDATLPADREYRTLPDGRVLTKFDGWFWEGYGWSMETSFSTAQIPLKIRFWAERMKAS